MSRRPPPPPTGILDALLARLRTEVGDFPMDPGLPVRVEAAVRALPRAGRARRSRGGWAVAAAAALACVLLGGLPSGVRMGPEVAHAGPQEARELWGRARATRGNPWRERALAYRRVVREAQATDPLRARALLALAAVLRDAHLVHGAAAAEAAAATPRPRVDETRLGALLRLAKALRDEGDLAGATPLLREVAEVGRREGHRLADEALDLLSEDALDLGDLPGTEAAAAQAERERAGAPVRIRLAGRAGEARLRAGDEAGAARHLAAAGRVVREAEREGGPVALLATKEWLDLPLRRRLGAGRPGAQGP